MCSYDFLAENFYMGIGATEFSRHTSIRLCAQLLMYMSPTMLTNTLHALVALVALVTTVLVGLLLPSSQISMEPF